jgi:hypothetical protein
MNSCPIQLHGATATSIPVRGVVRIPPVLLEDLAGDTLMGSSFGSVVMGLFQPLFRASAWPIVSLLACGGALATERHPITTSLGLPGAPTVHHFARFDVCLGCPSTTAAGISGGR